MVTKYVADRNSPSLLKKSPCIDLYGMQCMGLYIGRTRYNSAHQRKFCRRALEKRWQHIIQLISFISRTSSRIHCNSIRLRFTGQRTVVSESLWKSFDSRPI